jgi:beta-lactamase class D
MESSTTKHTFTWCSNSCNRVLCLTTWKSSKNFQSKTRPKRSGTWLSPSSTFKIEGSLTGTSSPKTS